MYCQSRTTKHVCPRPYVKNYVLCGKIWSRVVISCSHPRFRLDIGSLVSEKVFQLGRENVDSLIQGDNIVRVCFEGKRKKVILCLKATRLLGKILRSLCTDHYVIMPYIAPGLGLCTIFSGENKNKTCILSTSSSYRVLNGDSDRVFLNRLVLTCAHQIYAERNTASQTNILMAKRAVYYASHIVLLNSILTPAGYILAKNIDREDILNGGEVYDVHNDSEFYNPVSRWFIFNAGYSGDSDLSSLIRKIDTEQ